MSNRLARTLFALFVVAAAAAGVAIWRLMGDGGAGPAGADATAAAEVREDDPAEIESGEIADPSAEPAEPDDALAQREPDPIAPRAAKPAVEAPAGTHFPDPIYVTVVSGSDGRPVAGATVALIDEGDLQRDALAPEFRDLSRRALALVKADGDGELELPRPARNSFVLASGEGLRGWRRVEPATFEPLRLPLTGPLAVAARVVDAEGRAQAGVAVAAATSELELAAAPAPVATAGDGTVTLTDMELLLPARDAGATAPRTLVVGLALPLAPPVAVTIDPDAPPVEPVTLKLPPTGSIAFQAVDDTGAPLPVAGPVDLWAGAASPDGDLLDPRRRGRAQRLALALDDRGRGLLEQVGLGLGLRAVPRIEGRPASSRIFAGPTKAGERIEVTLPIGAVGPLFHGQLVDAEKRPFGVAELEGSLDISDAGERPRGARRARAPVAADGSFTLDWSGHPLRGQPLTFRLDLRATRPGEAGVDVAVASLAVELPEEGVVELGAIELTAVPLLARGHVVDDDGRPVEEAVVRPLVRLAGGRMVPDGAARAVVTDAAGAFELRADPPVGELLLQASRSAFLPADPVAITAGADDVTLLLTLGGSLAGSVALPPDFPRELLHFSLAAADGGAHIRNAEIEPDGTLRFALLAPGTYDGALRLGRDARRGDSIATFDHVAVRAGAVTRDPRMQPIVLSSLLQFVDVTVHLPGGDLAHDGLVAAYASDRDRDPLTVPLRDGRALVPSPQTPFELRINVPGYRIESIPSPPSRVERTLREGVRVRLVMNERVPDRPDWIPARVTVRPTDRVLANSWPARSVDFDGNAAATTLPSAGQWRASIDFIPPRAAGEDDAAWARRTRRHRQRVDVLFKAGESASEQTIELSLRH